jgi:hypothetical protein
VSKAEIARVKAEWEAKEARKKAKENEKSGAEGKEKEEKDKETGGDGKKNDGAKSPSPSIPGGVSSSSSPSSSSPPSGSSAAATPTHKRYSLHRDFYAMRQAEHRRRRQTKQMQELAPRLPGAPQGSFLG